MKAIVKAIQKVTQWITKALTAAFGKVIGGALAGLINTVINILTFPVHVAYYASQGDWKGLLKYMANTALQIAMIAIQFIPGVGQVIGTLFQYLGTFLQWMGQGLVFAGNLFGKLLGPALGSLVKGALHFAGGFLEGFGGSLIQQGKNLIQNSRNIFQNLKDQGFKYVTDSLKKGFTKLLDLVNPVSYYKTLSQSVTESLNKLGLKGSLSKLLDSSKTQFLVNLAQQKIDKSLEKSKMNSFLKEILSTVSSAGLQGMGSFFREGILPPRETAPAEATRSRAPPTGLAAVIEQIKGAFSSVGGFVTDALKDSAGFIKSLFIRGDASLRPNAEITFSSEGESSFYKPLDGKIDLAYALESLPQGLHRASLDGGDWQFFKLDPQTKFIFSQERIGNLPPLFPDPDGIDYFTKFYLPALVQGFPETTVQAVGGYAVGLTEGFIEAGIGTFQALTRPAQTGAALVQALSHPKETFSAIRTSFQQTFDTIVAGGVNPFESARAIGRPVGGVLFGLATQGVGKAAGARILAESGFDPTSTFRGGKFREIILKPGTRLERAFQEGVNEPFSPFTTRGATARRVTSTESAIKELGLRNTSGVRPNTVTTLEVTRPIKAKVGFMQDGGKRAIQYVIDPKDKSALREIRRLRRKIS